MDFWEMRRLADLLFDQGPGWEGKVYLLPGQSWAEWVALAERDWDEVDRLLLDYETSGGD